eukprot:4244170-Amphidinium_carterae.1
MLLIECVGSRPPMFSCWRTQRCVVIGSQRAGVTWRLEQFSHAADGACACVCCLCACVRARINQHTYAYARTSWQGFVCPQKFRKPNRDHWYQNHCLVLA